MSKNIIFSCKKCGAQSPKWSGRCLECGAWGTIAAEAAPVARSAKKSSAASYQPGTVKELSAAENASPLLRLPTGFREFDQVIGGGIVSAGLILLGGDPGVGKSTLALQVAALSGLNVLYVSAEEIESQVAERLSRLNSQATVKFLNANRVETIVATILQEAPQLVIIDSIQTIFSDELAAEAGSINQVKAATVKLVELAKNHNIAIMVIGHVTKGGEVAGPKTLEHLVDTVLYLEGDRYKQYRLLRAVKNRFGPTDEVGILQMSKTGLKSVSNPSKIFLAEAHNQPGSVITAVAEGSQVFLVEVQALVSKTAAGYPRRQSSGFDQKRLELLATVIGKRAGFNLANFDIYLNIAGGLVLREPALDLAVVAAIISAYREAAWSQKTVIFGEVGLAGEVRPVTKTKERIKEAARLGFKNIVLPDLAGQATGARLIKVKEVKELPALFT